MSMGIDTRGRKLMTTPRGCCCTGHHKGRSRVGSTSEVFGRLFESAAALPVLADFVAEGGFEPSLDRGMGFLTAARNLQAPPGHSARRIHELPGHR